MTKVQGKIKVLAIIGSPRKKSSYKAAQMLQERMTARGEVEFEYLFLRDAHLEPCRGCHQCIIEGETYCPLDDDVAKIAAQMQAADGIIFVTPTYSQHVTALMKGFLDRFAYYYHRPRLFGKKAMAIVTGGGQFKEIFKYLAFNSKCWGLDFVGKLGVPHLDGLTPKFKAKVLKEIDDSAAAFYRALAAPKSRPLRLADLLWFKMWQINAQANKDGLVADYDYWTKQGWFDKNYYYETEIGMFKIWLSKLISRLMRVYMHRMYVGY